VNLKCDIKEGYKKEKDKKIGEELKSISIALNRIEWLAFC